MHYMCNRPVWAAAPARQRCELESQHRPSSYDLVLPFAPAWPSGLLAAHAMDGPCGTHYTYVPRKTVQGLAVTEAMQQRYPMACKQQSNGCKSKKKKKLTQLSGRPHT
jgi:hypothetical protein